MFDLISFKTDQTIIATKIARQNNIVAEDKKS